MRQEQLRKYLRRAVPHSQDIHGANNLDNLNAPTPLWYQDESDIRAQSAFNIPVRKAAVLIAVTCQNEPGIIFVERPAHMRNHASQIAFPGGKADPEDKDATATALRETEEELGIKAHNVEVITPIDQYCSGSGYDIRPILSIIPANLSFTPCPSEVAGWFEAPLSHFMNRHNYKKMQVEWQGNLRQYYEIYWQEKRIWGITAGILRHLRYRLNGQ